MSCDGHESLCNRCFDVAGHLLSFIFDVTSHSRQLFYERKLIIFRF